MIGIDTPETGKGDRPKGCFGDEASAHLTELLHGEPVSLIPDPTQSLYDKYDRALMYVEQNGRDINAMMIADGYAREYTYRTPYERQTLYRSLEDEARHAKKGLWASDVCDITAP
jgi:micrococcal nuclease